MNNIARYIRYWALAMLLVFSASCMKDGEMLIAELENGEVNVSSADNDIVLTKDNTSKLVLTVYWTESGDVTLSNPDAQIPSSAMETSLQFSSTENFTDFYEVSVTASRMSAQFTGSQLNVILSRLGYEGGVKAPLYIRMKTLLGSNAEPFYGNPLVMDVTPFKIDMSVVNIVNTDKVTVTASLPALSDDVYAGFANISAAWYNFYFVEGDGTVWGNDGVTGSPFMVSSDENTMWNCWFPDAKGCFYITLDKAGLEWTALNVPSLTLTAGDVTAEMQYYGSKNMWRGVFTPSSSNVTVAAAGTGAYYCIATGDSSSEEKAVTFNAAADGSLELADGNASSQIVAAEAMTYTLFLHLDTMTWELLEGDVEAGDDDNSQWPEDPDYVAAASPYLYLYNLVDGEPDSVAGKLKMTDEGYKGFFHMGAWYNFKFGDSEDPASAKIYGSAPTSDEGALYRLFCGSSMWNIWFDSETSYTYLTVDMGSRSWGYEIIETIEIVGDFNGWTLGSNLMAYDSKTRTWSAEIEPESWGDYGIKFLVNSQSGESENWNWAYSDNDGDGLLEASTAEFMPAVEPGQKYRITIDLNDPDAMTCRIVPASDEGEGGDDSKPEKLYAYWTWSGSGNWVSDELAGTLERTDDGYYGYISACGDGLYRNITLLEEFTEAGNASNIGAIGESNGSLGVCDNTSIWPIWLETGLARIEVDADITALTKTYLIPCVEGAFNGWSLNANRMVFDEVNHVWQATCHIDEPQSDIQIVLSTDGVNDWSYEYGDTGADGRLDLKGTKISVSEAGTYLFEADFSDASNLTYTITKQ